MPARLLWSRQGSLCMKHRNMQNLNGKWILCVMHDVEPWIHYAVANFKCPFEGIWFFRTLPPQAWFNGVDGKRSQRKRIPGNITYLIHRTRWLEEEYTFNSLHFSYTFICNSLAWSALAAAYVQEASRRESLICQTAFNSNVVVLLVASAMDMFRHCWHLAWLAKKSWHWNIGSSWIFVSKMDRFRCNPGNLNLPRLQFRTMSSLSCASPCGELKLDKGWPKSAFSGDAVRIGDAGSGKTSRSLRVMKFPWECWQWSKGFEFGLQVDDWVTLRLSKICLCWVPPGHWLPHSVFFSFASRITDDGWHSVKIESACIFNTERHLSAKCKDHQ